MKRLWDALDNNLTLHFIRGQFTLIWEINITVIIIVNVEFAMLRVGQREKTNIALTYILLISLTNVIFK